MAYSEKVIDHYENPRNVGVLDKDAENVGTGMVGAPACGDVMRLQIQVDGNGIIESQENMAADTKQGENEQAHDHKEDTMLPHTSKSKCSR